MNQIFESKAVFHSKMKGIMKGNPNTKAERICEGSTHKNKN